MTEYEDINKILEGKPKIKENLLLKEAEDLYLIIDPEIGEIFGGNSVAGRILELCDGSKTGSDIVQIILSEFSNVSVEECKTEVANFIKLAQNNNVLS